MKSLGLSPTEQEVVDMQVPILYRVSGSNCPIFENKTKEPNNSKIFIFMN